MTIRVSHYCIVISLTILGLLSCSRKVITNETSRHTNNTVIVDGKSPYLLLVSLDGFRWDYVDTYKPPHLSKFVSQGVRAESLAPSFPSKTFPNHYTIATGMYPNNHGLLGNVYYSHDHDATYKVRDRSKVEDGSYYGGTPIWVQASKAGMRTASYFFVGTEADIQGIRPDYYYKYDGNVKNSTRVQQVLDWFGMPPNERPQFVAMYFSDMDDIGHRYGPSDEAQIKKSLFALDSIIGTLLHGIEDLDLPINIIIVSDHGMLDIPTKNLIPTESIKNDELYSIIDNGSVINIHPNDDSKVDSIYKYLKQKEGNFEVYKTQETPQFEHTPSNRDWGEVQVVADVGYYFSDMRRIALVRGTKSVIGQHGFDPNIKEMHGIFYAKGPAFKQGYTAPSAKNIHVYPIMCKVLGLDIPDEVDGDIEVLKSVLKGQ